MVVAGDAGSVFSIAHIAITAAIATCVSLALLRWRLRERSLGEAALLALIAGISVFIWRLSANVPQLNDDGVPGFSPNDWLCPVITYVFLETYAAFRRPPDAVRWAQARSLLVLAALASNVVTI